MKKLGFGGMRFPLIRPDDPKSVDQEQVNRMVDEFLSKGFSYFDTAYMYHDGCSEEVFRKALVQRHSREKFLLADKMPTFLVNGPQDYETIFAAQQKRCGVDFFDYYLLHNLNRHTYENTVKFGGFEYMARLKKEGKIRRMGFSFHDTPEMLEEILTRYPHMEFVQLQLNYVDWESPIVQAQECYETARRHGKPIIVMEPVKGGGLAKLPAEAERVLQAARPDRSPVSWALRYAASLEGVIMVLSGMSSLAQLVENSDIMKEVLPLDEAEKQAIKEAARIINSATAVPCTNCRYCIAACPKQIDIPGYFSIYNAYRRFDTLDHHKFQYQRQIVGHGKASECIGCGQCSSHCPQHIQIPEELKKVAGTFE